MSLGRRGARVERSIGKLAAIALVGLTTSAMSCGSAPARVPASASAPPLHLDPLADLAPAAGLVWLVQLRPREIAGRAELIPALSELVPDDRMRVFASRNGGVDPREVVELVIARYPAATLVLARVPIEPARVEAAFAARVVAVDGRAVDRAGDALGTISRVWGTAFGDRQQVALFGREAVGVETGRFGPLRAAEMFAEGRMKRASPALRATPLARASELAGDAPIRAFAPGPFDGEWARAAGGLLGACTAVALTIRIEAPSHSAPTPTPTPTPTATATDTPARQRMTPHDPERVELTFAITLLGAWGGDAPAAADRLRASFDLLAASGLGRLIGLDRPTSAVRVRAGAEALTLELGLDAMTLAKGLHAATGARVDEIMR